ncbi:AAA family ATPase [Micromonospora sp. MP36]|uniref:AAA family ATPase n=1 Tax=Micromonospora sp. MP36 TaxID=2604468 RepID=UPI001651D171|nr:AAA family ATPase [Micromonospora sp. MP36]
MSPGMVGRERELAALRVVLSGPPVIVLVEGEAGIGKSRLVQEMLATGTPVRRVLLATCPAYRQPFTLGPLVDAIRPAAEDVAGLGLSGLAGALRPLFPEWASALPPAPEPAEDAAAARHRLFRALEEILERLDVGLLVVEDLHWADEATLEFLLFLASRPRQQVSLLVSYRPGEITADSLLLRLSSRQPAGTSRLRLSLEPLDILGTAEMVSSMLSGERVSDDFATEVISSAPPPCSPGRPRRGRAFHGRTTRCSAGSDRPPACCARTGRTPRSPSLRRPSRGCPPSVPVATPCASCTPCVHTVWR